MKSLIPIMSVITILVSPSPLKRENSFEFHDLVYRGEKWEVIHTIPDYKVIELQN